MFIELIRKERMCHASIHRDDGNVPNKKYFLLYKYNFSIFRFILCFEEYFDPPCRLGWDPMSSRAMPGLIPMLCLYKSIKKRS